MDDRLPEERPGKDEILAEALACGFRAENIDFSVDSEGVDNAHIYPIGDPDEAFRESVSCMIAWAAATGAAIGFSFQPRSH
jgi:hypothetical protein